MLLVTTLFVHLHESKAMSHPATFLEEKWLNEIDTPFEQQQVSALMDVSKRHAWRSRS